MKKVTAAALAVSMAMSMAVSAGAAENTNADNGKKPGENSTIEVQAKVNSNPKDTIYSVDLTWDSMVFTYTNNVKYTWNPTTHRYDESENGGSWDKSSANITGTNHSNAAVNVGFAFAAENGFAGSFKYNNAGTSSISLNAGEEGKPQDADSKTVTFELSTMPSLSKDAKIGTITISISGQ